MACSGCPINISYYWRAYSFKGMSVLITFKMEIWLLKGRSSNPNLSSIITVNDINSIRMTLYSVTRWCCELGCHGTHPPSQWQCQDEAPAGGILIREASSTFKCCVLCIFEVYCMGKYGNHRIFLKVAFCVFHVVLPGFVHYSTILPHTPTCPHKHTHTHTRMLSLLKGWVTIKEQMVKYFDLRVPCK